MHQRHASKMPLKIAALLTTTISALMMTAQPAFAADNTATNTATNTAINPLLNCSLPSNCVNSRTSNGLAPLHFVGTAAQGLALLKTTLASFPEARIQLEDDSTVKTIFSTPIGFKDDVIFLIDVQQQQIDFQSHSGFGLYDFGKNRSRMQAVSTRFAEVAAAAGAAAGAGAK